MQRYQARRLCYILEYANKRNIKYIIEQPLSSLLFCFKPVRDTLARHKCLQVTLDMGAYGADSTKPTKWARHSLTRKTFALYLGQV